MAEIQNSSQFGGKLSEATGGDRKGKTEMNMHNSFHVTYRIGDQFWSHLAEDTNSAAPIESSRWQHHEWDWFGWTSGLLSSVWSHVITGEILIAKDSCLCVNVLGNTGEKSQITWYVRDDFQSQESVWWNTCKVNLLSVVYACY